MQGLKFKQRRGMRGGAACLLAAPLRLVALILLAGCAQSPVRNAETTQPLARLQPPAPSAAADSASQVIAAEFALTRNDLRSAATDYARAAVLSDDPAIAERAVGLNLAVGDAAQMQAAIARWQTLGAKPGDLARARGQLALLQGNRAEAVRQFGTLIGSNQPDAWRALGSALLDARDSALAGTVLETLATPQRLPTDEKLWVALSQLGEKLGRHAFARKLADNAVERFGGGPSLAWDARMKLDTGDRNGARDLFARAIARDPSDTHLRIAYAALLDTLGDRANALRTLAQGKQDSDTYAARAAYAARDKNQTALRALYEEMQRAPAATRDDNDFLLGQLAELLGRDRAAQGWYAQVPDDDAHAFDAQVRIAVLADKAGHPQQAHAIAQQLQQDYADDPDSLRRACLLDAELYVRANDSKNAIAAYNRGLQVLPDDHDLLYGRALTEAQAGETAQAIADLRRVLKLKPDDVEVMNALGYTLADADQDLAEATTLLSQALKAKPDEPAFIDSWGWLQYRLGHLGVAERSLQRAWSKSRDPDVGVHLGEVLWKRGDRAQARAVFAQVRKRDPHNESLRAALARLHP